MNELRYMMELGHGKMEVFDLRKAADFLDVGVAETSDFERTHAIGGIRLFRHLIGTLDDTVDNFCYANSIPPLVRLTPHPRVGGIIEAGWPSRGLSHMTYYGEHGRIASDVLLELAIKLLDAMYKYGDLITGDTSWRVFNNECRRSLPQLKW